MALRRSSHGPATIVPTPSAQGRGPRAAALGVLAFGAVTFPGDGARAVDLARDAVRPSGLPVATTELVVRAGAARHRLEQHRPQRRVDRRPQVVHLEPQPSGQAVGRDRDVRFGKPVGDRVAPHRPTRDADLLGFGPDDAAHLVSTFRAIGAIDLGDGIVFGVDSVKAAVIREDATCGGTRITMTARIGSARCGLQIDVGFGDAVTPAPQMATWSRALSRWVRHIGR